jgi:hypothetical protein
MYALSTKQEALLAENTPTLTVQRTLTPDSSTRTYSVSERPIGNDHPGPALKLSTNLYDI